VYVPPGQVPEVPAPETPPSDSPLWGTLVGTFAREAAPVTEAGPINTSMQFLAMFSAYVSGAYTWVGGTKHAANLFAVIVGPTASAHKGDAERLAEASIHAAVPDKWVRKVKGVSSGEGIIYSVRDGVLNEEGVLVGGVEDKRLLIVEPEFARILKVMERNGSTVSTVLREAYEASHLQTLTKNSPDMATNPHISFIGHITADELRADLKRVEMANGLGNRFLWIYSTRAQVLANPGIYDPSEQLIRHLRDALEFGSQVRLIMRSTAADAYWDKAYQELSEPAPGLIGSMLARNPANALRLSMVFAIMRCSESIEPEDIQAALEIVGYSTDSVRYLFEAANVDPHERKVIEALEVAPRRELTRLEINTAVFQHHVSASEIDGIRDVLVYRNLVEVTKVKSGGRPTETWRLK
jgi:hypothetical protein